MRSSSRLSSSRRQFLERLGLFSAASCLSARELISLGKVDSNLPFSGSVPTIKNRAPLAPSAFNMLPLGSIRPKGWLLEQLRIQAHGLSGHLDETWADVGPNSGWLGGSGESWERGPYFLDGLLPLAYMLEDSHLKAKAQKYIDWTLDHQSKNGMIGPAMNNDWWPRMVMLKVLTQYHELSGDTRVIPVMDRYFSYQLKELPSRPLRDWGKFRWQDEVLSVLWLYNRTGSSYLLEVANLLHRQGHDWIAQFADFKFTERVTSAYLKLDQGNGLDDLSLSTHGVNNGQAIKTGPVWSLVSGSKSDRAAVLKAISELDKYHGLPNGMFSCDEHLAGLNPSQGSELCTVVEYMYSLEHALSILGDPSLGDRLELLAFNALPGTFTDDMWAHQYNQEPNQVECSLHREPWTTDGPESNLFGLEPNFGCCTANFHQGWPKFVSSTFMLSGEQGNSERDGLVAGVYAPCEVRATIRGVQVHIVEETDYPFNGSVRLTVTPTSRVSFPLQLRIPQWADTTVISVNGQKQPPPAAGSFATVERSWKSGDSVEIEFPMKPRLTVGFKNSVSIHRGPLVFSHGIGEDWLKLRNRDMTADWQVYPTTPWNYALSVNESTIPTDIKVVEEKLTEGPFTRKHTPVRLQVKAKKVTEWQALDGVAGVVPQSPILTKEPEEVIELIPYAAAKLRITSFPRI